MMSLITSGLVKMIIGATALSTLGTGRTARVDFADGNYWTKTVIAESKETGFSINIDRMSWDGTHIRAWIPDDHGTFTMIDLHKK